MLAATETESFTQTQIFAGSADVVTVPVTVVSGQNLAIRAVVGRVTASGKIKICDTAAVDGSQTPIGILVNAVDASGGDKAGDIYVGGDFNVDALTWHASFSTDVLKLKAFDNSNITVRNLVFSVG
jgi:hypothetical protein